jgi:hypothetical protein
MLDYIRHVGLPVFHTYSPLEDEGVMFWDNEAFPDWRQFVDVAKESGARLIVFASQQLDESDLEQAFEKLEECEMNSEERRSYATQFELLRKYVDQTSWIRLAFEHAGQWLACEFVAPWQDEYDSAMDDLDTFLPFQVDEEDEEPDRGLFSRN